MGLFSGLFGKGDPVKLEDQRTPQQLQNAQFLSQLGLTGSAGGLNLGEAFQGSLGDFNPTQFEQSGLSQLFNQGTNKNLQGAADTFSRLSESGLPSGLIESFRKEAGKARLEGGDLLNREAAITGSRFGTQIAGEKRKLEGDIQDSFQSNLAKLLLGQQGINLQGAQGLANVGQAQFGQEQQNLQNLFGFGSLKRNLGNQEAQAKFNEFNRQRAEQLSRVDIATGAANRNPSLGISELPGSPSPFSSLISSVLGSVGQGFGLGFGGSTFSKLFPGGK